MQFFNLILIALASASVNAVDCWKSGPNTSAENVVEKLYYVCSYMEANYTPEEERYVCIVDNIGVKWDFALKHISGGVRWIGVPECMDGMRKQIGCKYGGVTSYSNWKYRADPNSGRCVGG